MGEGRSEGEREGEGEEGRRREEKIIRERRREVEAKGQVINHTALIVTHYTK